MTTTIQVAKSELRQRLGDRFARVTAAERAEASSKVVAALRSWEVWRRAERTLFYAPMAAEVDVWPLVEEAWSTGRLVVLPRYRPAGRQYEGAVVQDPERDLVTGRLGIREPAGHCRTYVLNQLDLVLVPGLGFDAFGRRLGRGRGFYDRLLAQAGGVFCGVAMDWQWLPFVPVEPHDVILDYVATPSRGVVCAPSRAAKR